VKCFPWLFVNGRGHLILPERTDTNVLSSDSGEESSEAATLKEWAKYLLMHRDRRFGRDCSGYRLVYGAIAELYLNCIFV
jgi:hypothetical protein